LPTEQPDFNEANCVVAQQPALNRWLLFSKPTKVLVAYQLNEIEALVKQVEIETQGKGLCAAGFLSYEAAPAFDTHLPSKTPDIVPLAWFGIYDNFEVIPFPALDDAPKPHLDWELRLAEGEYPTALAKVKDYIREGDTYQVNYSFRMRAEHNDDCWSLFVKMVHAQDLANNAGYCVYVNTDDWAVCSASPELFFSYEGRELVSKPMKGTAPRGLAFEDDNLSAKTLRASEKNCAENIMITDMVRNDMGKIADIGSVITTDILALEKYPTFWTMTSTVTCQTDPKLWSILEALFPAASITGAPKQRAMEVIDELESLPRHIYTGSVGFILPGDSATFNVAIRTVLVDKQHQQAEFGVGGGIVWDSETSDEYAECHTKASVLTYTQQQFDLLETLKWTPEQGYHDLSAHLQRLADSANYFAWSCNTANIENALQQATKAFRTSDQRVRLRVSKHGNINVETQDLTCLPQNYQTALADKPVSAKNFFLYHKTTHRTVYEQAMASVSGAHDVILWNEQDEITESCIANVVIEQNGKLYTPPVSSGLLNGIERDKLVKSGKLIERVISKHDLETACDIWLVNSVRGYWRVDLIDI
jgi:para-aminobenzoate synthetase/4-amino-4-deoxychorismate lyase